MHSYPQPRKRHPPARRSPIARHAIMLIGVVLVVLFGAASVYKLLGSHSVSSVSEVRSGITGYCLDDHHDGKAPNAKADIWPCNGSAAQNWLITDRTIRHDGAACLSVENNAKTSGSAIVLNTCNHSAGQIWVVDLGGYENPASSLCLDSPDKKAGSGLNIASSNDLTQFNEAWTAATWSPVNGSEPSCAVGTEGVRVACYAERQWTAWQSGSPSHEMLLSDYSDGNAYEEWCADFVSYVYKEAGFPFTQGERNGWDEYNANNIQYMGLTMHPASGYEPKPGDVAFFDYPGGHVEIVVVGGKNPTFIYGDSNTIDSTTGNGEMNEDTLTNDGSAGQVVYYLSPN